MDVTATQWQIDTMAMQMSVTGEELWRDVHGWSGSTRLDIAAINYGVGRGDGRWKQPLLCYRPCAIT